MYKEFKDFVPDGTYKYNITDNTDGTKNIALSTEVVEEGTPLNKATFANMQGDIYTSSQYSTPTYSGTAMALDLPLSSYETGKIINITSPTTFSSYPTIDINGLGAKTINSKLYVGKKYTLIYNGTTFDVILEDKSLSIPTGLICMWSGSTIPTGWHICDGTNGTPDLRNRFIVGSGSTYAIGDTGGSDSVTLTVDEIPSHTHTYTLATFKSSYYGTNSNIQTYSSASSHDTGATGGGNAHENRPPYYALAYIMKL